MTSPPDASPVRATAEIESESVRMLSDLSAKLARYLAAVRADGRLSGGTIQGLRRRHAQSAGYRLA